MKRTYLVISLLLLIALTSIVWAQERSNEPTPIPMASPPLDMVPIGPATAVVTQTITLEASPLAVAAADSCSGATKLTIPGGDSAIVNSYTTGLSDPNLTCMWGAPASLQGYRSAWYTFTPTSNGTAVIRTLGSNYDTVLAVHSDYNPADGIPACIDLRPLACNDDSNGFTSEISVTVLAGQEYYIEVVDWRASASGNAQLLISLEMEPVASQWQQSGFMSLARSRHATVVVNNQIYTIGGQTNVQGNPTLTARIDRFDPSSGQWTALGQMPGAGYSNTTAVYLNKQLPNGKCSQGCIYLPGGYDGASTYNGTHWAFDLSNREWFTRANIGEQLFWPHNTPYAWATAVARPDQTGYYLMGGLSSQPPITPTQFVHNKVYFYQLDTNKWDDAPPDMDSPRYGHMAAYVGSEVCVIGGIDANFNLLPNGECWDPNGGAGWHAMPPLNIARYGAGSAVGPDGKWYIFGGSGANHRALSSIEVYDPDQSAWALLNVSYDLGAHDGNPARAWPRGGFVGNHLWAIGGNATVDTYPALSLIEKLFIGRFTIDMPIVLKQSADNDNNFESARPLPFNVPQFKNFNSQLDFYDMYSFDLNTTSGVVARLSQIPTGSDYNLYIYDSNKLLWGAGTNPSNLDEGVALTLAPGRYYVMVERHFPFGIPNPAHYRLIVQR